MAKNPNDERNINEPGYDLDDRPYYDDKSEKEEVEKVPVEYLGYLQHQKEVRTGKAFLWIVLVVIIFGLAPGTRSQLYCARSGEVRDHLTFAWGFLEFNDIPEATAWTDWYESKNPEAHEMRWVPFGESRPAIFGYIAFPFKTDLGWIMPDNLITRMEELDDVLRPRGSVMDIPRVLNAVNTGSEWNAIILPLTEGTVEDAEEWWSDNKSMLIRWSDDEPGTPLSMDYIARATERVESIRQEDGNHIPLY